MTHAERVTTGGATTRIDPVTMNTNTERVTMHWWGNNKNWSNCNEHWHGKGDHWPGEVTTRIEPMTIEESSVTEMTILHVSMQWISFVSQLKKWHSRMPTASNSWCKVLRLVATEQKHVMTVWRYKYCIIVPSISFSAWWHAHHNC